MGKIDRLHDTGQLGRCVAVDFDEEVTVKTHTLEFPPEKLTKLIPCSKCGRQMQVNDRTVMAFCGDCSAGMGVKK